MLGGRAATWRNGPLEATEPKMMEQLTAYRPTSRSRKTKLPPCNIMACASDEPNPSAVVAIDPAVQLESGGNESLLERFGPSLGARCTPWAPERAVGPGRPAPWPRFPGGR